MHRGRTLAAVLGALACLVVLGGCGGNPEPTPLADPTPSTSATTTPSPSPPAIPAAARKKTKAGAIAFARHFIEALNYAGKIGDTKPLRAVVLAAAARVRGHCRRH